MRTEFEQFLERLPKQVITDEIPVYKRTLDVAFSSELFQPLAMSTAKELSWEILHVQKDTIVLRCDGTPSSRYCTVSVHYKDGCIRIDSTCDFQRPEGDAGDCHQKAELFAFAIVTVFEALDEYAIEELLQEHHNKIGWNNCKEPSELPKHPMVSLENMLAPVIAAIGLGVAFGVATHILTLYNLNYFLLIQYGLGLVLAAGISKILVNAGILRTKPILAILFLCTVSFAFTEVIADFLAMRSESMMRNLSPRDRMSLPEFVNYVAEGSLGISRRLSQPNSLGNGTYVLYWLSQLLIPAFVAERRIRKVLPDLLLKKISNTVLEYCMFMRDTKISLPKMHEKLIQCGWTSEAWRDAAIVSAMGLSTIKDDLQHVEEDIEDEEELGFWDGTYPGPDDK